MKTPILQIKDNLYSMDAIEFSKWLSNNLNNLSEQEKKMIIDGFDNGIKETLSCDWWGGTTKLNGIDYYERLIG